MSCEDFGKINIESLKHALKAKTDVTCEECQKNIKKKLSKDNKLKLKRLEELD